jgi:hypothetical protein
MIQYSLLGPSAVSTDLNRTFCGLALSPSSGRTDLTHHLSVGGGLNQFYLRMGTEPVPETYLNHLTRLMAQEDYIEFVTSAVIREVFIF